MSHLKVHLRFYFKKHENCQKMSDAFDDEQMVHLTMQSTPLNLFAHPLLYLTQSRTNRIVDILKLDSEADVHRCLQPFTEKGLFMSIFFTKVADRKPEKRLHQRCFPVSLPNIAKLFFVKHVCETLSIFFVASTSSAKYYSRPWLYSDYL